MAITHTCGYIAKHVFADAIQAHSSQGGLPPTSKSPETCYKKGGLGGPISELFLA